MIVVTAGIPRSGSTWLFNVVRLAIETHFTVVYSCWIDDFEPEKAATADASVVKIHEPDVGLVQQATHVFTSHRDLRDIAASLRSLNGFAIDDDQMVASAAHARKLHEFWSPQATLDVAYEDIVGNARRQIARIVRRLRLPVDFETSRTIEATVAALPSPTDAAIRHDPISLLHVNHRNDGRAGRWRDQISAETASRIAAANREWLVAFGYED